VAILTPCKRSQSYECCEGGLNIASRHSTTPILRFTKQCWRRHGPLLSSLYSHRCSRKITVKTQTLNTARSLRRTIARPPREPTANIIGVSSLSRHCSVWPYLKHERTLCRVLGDVIAHDMIAAADFPSHALICYESGERISDATSILGHPSQSFSFLVVSSSPSKSLLHCTLSYPMRRNTLDTSLR
jgi:hypothetical protein